MSRRTALILLALGVWLGVVFAAGVWLGRSSHAPAPSVRRIPVLPPQPGELTLYFIDVGQGDAILAVSPEGHAMLVDTGPGASSESLDKALRATRIKSLQMLVLTHVHQDHIGGVAAALRRCRVREVWTNATPFTSLNERDCMHALQRQRLQPRPWPLGEPKHLGASVRVEPLRLDPPLPGDTSENNNSLALRLVYGRTRVLLCADQEQRARDALLQDGAGVDADVLKVAHHGSQNGLDMQWLRRVSPRYAVISVGQDNPWGHPVLETLRMLQSQRVQVWRTDLHGTITLRAGGNGSITIQAEYPDGR